MTAAGVPWPPAALAKVESRRERLSSYSYLHHASGRVLVPKDADELAEIFAFARRDGREVTIRGGGHAFDSQSLGRDLVVSMEKFQKVDVDSDAKLVTVEAGARWVDVVDKLEQRGMVAAGTVTASRATVGGTLAADCLSRFSGAYGKEGARVEHFELLAPGRKKPLMCTPPKGARPRALGQQAFLAAIGGYGYVGAILNAQLRVYPVERPIKVQTTIEKTRTFRDLAEKLVPAACAACERAGKPSYPVDPFHDAISAALYPLGRDNPSALVFTSRFVTTNERRPLALYEPRDRRRLPVEVMMWLPPAARALSAGFFQIVDTRKPYYNELADFLFFMDGNAREKMLKYFHRAVPTLQQTFVVPANVVADAAQAQRRLVDWLDCANEVFERYDLTPTLVDVLYLKEDLPLYLSPNPREAGFAVSYAFETSNEKTLGLVRVAFYELADLLGSSRFRGRVSLVKNVVASPATLAAMYGRGARAFFDLKRRLDPENVLRNEFLEKTFGGFLGGSSGGPATSSAPTVPDDLG